MDQKSKTIYKKEIPLRKTEFKGKVIISAIFLLIAFIFKSKVFGVIGILFFLFFYWVYKDGSIYSTFKVMRNTYYGIKRRYDGNNKDTIRDTIIFRTKSSLKMSSPQLYVSSAMFLIEEMINEGYFSYADEEFLIYVASVGVWMSDNNLHNDPLVRKFLLSQVKQLREN